MIFLFDTTGTQVSEVSVSVSGINENNYVYDIEVEFNTITFAVTNNCNLASGVIIIFLNSVSQENSIFGYIHFTEPLQLQSGDTLELNSPVMRL